MNAMAHAHEPARPCSGSCGGRVTKGLARGVIAFLVLGAGVLLAVPSADAAPRRCPPDPRPGSTVPGSLTVVGDCHLRRVTVGGSVTIRSGARLVTSRSRIAGSTYVAPRGELDSGYDPFNQVTTFTPSRFVGSVTWDRGRDINLFNATITGSLTLNAGEAISGFAPAVCGSAITGRLSLSNNVRSEGFFVGDPDELIFGQYRCPANRLGGSVLLRNSRNVEMEGNAITGSASLLNSHIDFWGNRVGGSLRCDKGSTLTDSDGDAKPNRVRGRNTCHR